MSTTNTIDKVYDTVLSIPDMNDTVKIQLSIQRKNVLLLAKVIERGLSATGGAEKENVPEIAPQETLQQLAEVSSELLKKAGLTDMNEKLKSFS